MNHLFLLEILVLDIRFFRDKAPPRKDILIKVNCSDFVDLEIQDLSLDEDLIKVVRDDELVEDSFDNDLNSGKSWLFAMLPSSLLEKMSNNGLNISIFHKENNVEALDSVVIEWNTSFKEMIMDSIDEPSSGYISPALIHEEFKTVKDNVINLFVRLSSMGKGINTHIQAIDVKAAELKSTRGKQYLFKGKHTATTFQCSKYGEGTSQEDLKHALFTAGGEEGESEAEDLNNNLIELMQFFMETASLYSMAPSAFKGASFNSAYMLAPVNLNAQPSSTQSLSRNAQPVKMYTDFQELMRPSRDSRVYEMSSVSKMDMHKELVNLKTVEKLLCNNKDCAGVQSFKEYGIGLLSRYQFEYVPDYYLSHANGRIDCYGPQSRFRRPMRPEEPFMRKGIRKTRL